MTTTRTNTALAIKIGTTPAILWTNRRTRSGELVVDGETYLHYDVSVDSVVRSGDNQPVIACRLQIGNVEGQASSLVLDTTKLQVPVTIKHVSFDDLGNQTVTVWFDGRTGKPAFEEDYVVLDCRIWTGRRGKVKLRKRVDLMTAHRPPEPGTKLLTVTLESA